MYYMACSAPKYKYLILKVILQEPAKCNDLNR